MPKTDLQKTENGNSAPRPPVVAVMGHVDHGKSTLLDYIRKTDIAGGETGGITQRIGAYEVVHTRADGKMKAITFLDTPGHEAFGAIRSRGANVADIAILVVSAEDGVMPQTMDAYNCIKKAGLPIIVAINKIDKPNADLERTKGSLAEKEIYLEGYGGDIPWTATSAKDGTGIMELLELIDLVAEINNFSGDENEMASGFIIEANRDNRRGSSATVIIKNGTLHQGEVVIAGGALASIKIMENDHGKMIREAKIGTPVRIIGWSELPEAGLPFITVKTKKEAEKIIEKNIEQIQNTLKERVPHSEKLQEKTDEQKIEMEQTVVIPIIIKADATGTIDAIMHELKKIDLDRVKIKIVSKGVGDISEGDSKTAESIKGTIIIGFNVGVDSRAKTIIERSSVEIKQFDIIYKLSEWLSDFIKEQTPKIKVEEKHGVIKILKIFSKEKDKQVVGGKVIEGQISVGNEVKITRRDVFLGNGKIRELQRQKVRVDEVASGAEFGAMLESKITVAPGDVIEPFTIVEK